MKLHAELVRETLKKHPYLKCLKPYAYYREEWLTAQDGMLYLKLQESKDKSLEEVLSLVNRYSKVNYCKYQFDHWHDAESFTYADSVEADVKGLFTILSGEAKKRIREDLARLRAYEERADRELLVDNCFI